MSLDEDDNDLRLFMSYMLAAIQTMFPEIGNETNALLKSPHLPPVSVLARNLTNELDRVDKTFILTLDDYQVIHENKVHDLVAELLKHPPEPMHLVLCTRRDPPLPLTSLRARAHMTEIRTRDLRFSVAETAAYVRRAAEIPIDESEAAILEQKTEGWVTGLRLITLSLHLREDLERTLAGLPEGNRYVLDYMAEEVVSQQPEAIQDFLLSTSILNRFCGSLCDAVCVSDTASEKREVNGREFLDWAEQSNLFVIPLDDEYRWFRYHHLFQDLLQRLLKRQASADDIDVRHKRASAWFEKNGLIHEAIQHSLAANDSAEVGQIIKRHRQEITNGEQWHRLDGWLDLLPAKIMENSPELLMLKAWSCDNRGHFDECVSLLDRLEVILDGPKSDECDYQRLRGEVHALCSLQHYEAGDGQMALTHAEQSLIRLSAESSSERGYAVIMLATSLQMTGSMERGCDIVYDALALARGTGTYHCRLLYTLCSMYWIAADLQALKQTSATMLMLGEDYVLPETIAFANYFHGVAQYHLNNLSKAEECLSRVVLGCSIPNMTPYLYSVFTLTLVYQAQGRPNEARELVAATIRQLLNIGSRFFMSVAQAFQAELALRQGRFAEAALWAKTFDAGNPSHAYMFFIPESAKAKVLIIQKTKTSLNQAKKLLTQLNRFLKSTHNTIFLIDVLLLQALLCDHLGEESKAFKKLTEALALAESGRIIRPFVDLGRKMADLLNRLARQDISVKYIGELLTAFRQERIGRVQTASHAQTAASFPEADTLLNESLSKRETEVLALLLQRMSNKEIADTMYLAPDTIKKHLYNIYQKLNVSGRHQAVDKAKALGIL